MVILLSSKPSLLPGSNQAHISHSLQTREKGTFIMGIFKDRDVFEIILV